MPFFSQPQTISLLQEALTYHQAGKLEQASDLYQKILKINPFDADTLNSFGMLYYQRKELIQAEELLKRAIKTDSKRPEFYNNLGIILQDKNNLEQAIFYYQKAIQLYANYAEAYLNLGTVYNTQKKWEEAEKSYLQALKIKPDYLKALLNLGNLFVSQGKIEQAEILYRKILNRNPCYINAYHSLGLLYVRQSRYPEAQQCFRQAIGLNPQWSPPYQDLGELLEAEHQFSVAESFYQQYLHLNPKNAHAHINLIRIALLQGDLTKAQAYYANGLMMMPDNAVISLFQLGFTPIIPIEVSEITTWQNITEDYLDTKLQNQAMIAEDLTEELKIPTLYRVYAGHNEREFRAKLAQLYLQCFPNLGFIASHCINYTFSGENKIKIGFLLAFGASHPVFKVTEGLIKLLNPEKFSIYIFLMREGRTLSEILKPYVHEISFLPHHLQEARMQIAGKSLDILFYPECILDLFAYFLTFARLAPLQCTSWGYPVTTGIPNMDMYLSTEYLEIENAQDHYTEKLVCLKNAALPIYYKKTNIAVSLLDKQSLGFNSETNIYICPQMLCKLQPDFDIILQKILEKDKQGIILLFAGKNDLWLKRLQQRLQLHLSDVERVHFFEQRTLSDYLSLLASCDVMLDSTHFGGGITTLDAFSIGLPIVTLPSEFARGRATLACYQQMGILDCIAQSVDEYVDIAVRLGTDVGYRAELRARILEKSGVLFENMAVVGEFEHFFEDFLQNLNG